MHTITLIANVHILSQKLTDSWSLPVRNFWQSQFLID